MSIVRKLRFLIVLISFSICLCFMSTTYSRYIADSTSDIQVLFAKWQILVNKTDITTGTSSSISFVPVMDTNPNVADNTIAPSSTGYFDIAIDPSNVDVSFKYTINLAVENSDMPDLMITKYAILPSTYVDGDAITTTTITDGTISNTLAFDKTTTNFKFSPFTVRVYFEWYEGDNEKMDDAQDTAAGEKAATDNTKFKMSANIKFEQEF